MKTKVIVRTALNYWPAWPVLIGLVLAVVTMCALFGRNLTSIANTTVPEGSIVYSIRAVGGPESLYRDVNEPPYATTPYPPLFYIFSAVLAGGMGSDVDTTYLAGRLVAILSTLAAFAAVG